jgi:predicted RNase H-like HicB family nuclease
VDLVAAAAACRLRKDGLSLQKIRKAVRLLKEHPDDVAHPLAALRLVTDGETVYRLTDDPGVLQDVLRGRQLVHVVGIKAICDQVHARLKREVRTVRERVQAGGKRYTVTVEPDLVDGGFIAECRALPGCVTDGETVEEALRNAREAIADWLAAGEERERAQAQ